MARQVKTDPAQTHGLRSKKNCGRGSCVFSYFYVFRTLRRSLRISLLPRSYAQAGGVKEPPAESPVLFWFIDFREDRNWLNLILLPVFRDFIHSAGSDGRALPRPPEIGSLPPTEISGW